MRLYKPNTGHAHEAISEAIVLMTCTSPAESSEVERMRSYLTKIISTDDETDILRKWADTAFANGTSIPSALGAMSAGIVSLKSTSERTVGENNGIAFLSMFPVGDGIDLRTGQFQMSVLSEIDPELLEQFVPEQHALAKKIVDMTVDTVLYEYVLNTAWGRKFLDGYTLRHALLISGMFPTLVNEVVTGFTEGLEELPNELLHALFFTPMVQGIPNVEPFNSDWFNELRNA